MIRPGVPAVGEPEQKPVRGKIDDGGDSDQVEE
jgi:hypothetical protein